MGRPAKAGAHQNRAARGGTGGFALIIVLWTLVLLTLIATQITATGRSETRLAANLRGAAMAQAAADGCVYQAIHRLLADTGGSWPPDTAPRDEAGPGARCTVRLGSEDGKFDLNSAPAEVLAALLRAVGVDRSEAQQLALDIVLWRFPSAQTTERTRAYQQAGLGYGPPGASFQTVSELAQVLGMTPAIYGRVRPLVTVFHEGDPDVRAADPVVRGVLTSLGVVIPAGPAQARPGRIAVIDVTAEAAGGSRASRHAIVRIGATTDRGGWTIFVWE